MKEHNSPAAWFWTGILALIAATGFILGLAAHNARADDVPAGPPVPPQAQQLAVVEWVVRGVIETKDRHPVGFLNYHATKFLAAKPCLAALNKPDAALSKAMKEAEDALKEKKPVVVHWTCGPNLVKDEGRGV